MIGLTSAVYTFITTLQNHLELEASGLLDRYEDYKGDRSRTQYLSDGE